MSQLQWRNSAGTTTTGDVNEELTARISFMDDDVRAVYIDWDDGEGGDPDNNANYTIIKCNPAKQVAIT